jgi:outer membrane protein TolC
MKKTCLLLVIFFLSPSFVLSLPHSMESLNSNHAPPSKVPLTTAIQEGLKKDYGYLNAILDLEKASLQQQLSAKNKLFRLDFDANYLYKSKTMAIDFPSIAIPDSVIIPGRKVEAGVHHNYDLKLGLIQPIFTGGILNNSVKLDMVRQSIALNQKLLQKNDIAGLIKSSYFQYHLLSRRKQSLLILEKTLDLHRQRIQDLFNEGLVRKSDLLETLSKIEEIQASVADIEQAIEKERIYFHKLCSYYPEQIDAAYTEESLPLDKALSYFKQHHPVLKTLEHQTALLALQRKITSGKYLPHLSTFAELHYGRPGIDFFENKWSLYFQAGIVLTIPVFDWNRLRTQKTLLDYEAQKLTNQKNEFVTDASVSLTTLYSSIEKLEDKKVHINQLLEYSKEDAALKEALYSEQQVPNVDYLAALLAREKNALLLQEINIQIESLRVRINTLIGKSKEEADG